MREAGIKPGPLHFLEGKNMTEVPRGYMDHSVTWKLSPRGNWYTRDLNRRATTTVFEKPNGKGFGFVSNDEFSEETFDSVEDAQAGAEEYFGK